MSLAVHQLLDTAPTCKPIRADLRNSTVTFDWPSNVLVRKADYIILPAEEAKAALEDAARFSIHLNPREDRPPLVSWDWDRAHYSAYRDGRHWSVYFEHPGEEGNHPRPFTWWGRVYVEDVHGVTWDAGLGRMVMDDFGDLVPVGM
ncbi:MAG: hypothetical protein ACK4F4_07255 [Hylemonella sp.]|uniref:hypothetical protein n=1 Tax=Hylemonella sp. TaxID=2066020 RepID=UPI00391D3B4B